LSGRPSPEEDVAAAVACAHALGLGAVEPVVLRLAHHTSVRLAPWPIVARVDSSGDVERTLPFMRRELDVAQHLARAGAPTVRPTRDPSPGPHVHGRCAMTLWDYVEHRPAREAADIAAAGAALADVHAALADYPGELPTLTQATDVCARLLADPQAMPALDARSRRFLAAQLDQLTDGLALDAAHCIGLHGDAHAGNILVTQAGPVWADLEAVRRAPLEWELSSLPRPGHVHFRSIDQALLQRLSLLRSATVAVWCWADADRGPEVREAAEYHLRRLRRRKLVGSAASG
jgi:hypothetical protein